MNAVEQRRVAMDRANEVRWERARLKRELAGGRVHPADVFLDPPPTLLTMKVRELLTALPNVGPKKTDRIMLTLRLSGLARLGTLTRDRRREIVEYVRLNYPLTWKCWERGGGARPSVPVGEAA